MKILLIYRGSAQSLLARSQHPSVNLFLLAISRKMARSQQELPTHTVTADLGRGDGVCRRQSGDGGAHAGERGPTGAQRGRMRHRLPEEAEARPEELPVVATEHSE